MRVLLMMLRRYLFLIVFIKAYAVGTHLNCFYKVCCGYAFELPQLVEAIQISTLNICFYKVYTNTWSV